MSTIFDVSVMPNQTMSTGRIAIFGTGFVNETSGSKNTANARIDPDRRPRTTPERAPIARPAIER